MHSILSMTRARSHHLEQACDKFVCCSRGSDGVHREHREDDECVHLFCHFVKARNRARSPTGASQGGTKSPMHGFAKKQKIMEINPRSPLIQGLLRRVEQLPSEEEGRDLEAEEELKEVASVLIDGALVRSGFSVPDSNECVSFMYAMLSSLHLTCTVQILYEGRPDPASIPRCL